MILSDVSRLDLAPIGTRLRTDLGWPQDRIDAATQQYRDFLASADKTLDGPSSPDVDEVWHFHLLDTHRYQADCRSLFGGFLHHIPASAPGEKCSKRLERPSAS